VGKKPKFMLEQATNDPGRRKRFRSALSLTSTLDKSMWSTSGLGRFTPRKETRYPLHGRLGGLQGRSGRMQKISPPKEFDPQTVQTVASRYTDSAIPAQKFLNDVHNNKLIILLKESSCNYYYFFYVKILWVMTDTNFLKKNYFFCFVTPCVLVDRYQLVEGKYRSMDSH
jgi:hypothetical protein